MEALSLLVSFSAILSVSSPALAQRSCQDVVASLDRIIEQPLICARKKCPDFKLRYLGSNVDDLCVKDCPHFASEDLNASEEELTRCRKNFTTTDQQDIYQIAFCVSASKTVALMVEPFMICGRTDKCQGTGVWNSPECMAQCQDGAQQLIEISTTAMERCGGFGWANRGLCTMLEKAMNVCFIPKQCDRLVKVLDDHCPQLKRAK